MRFFVTTHERIYDPSNERDRRTLLEDAVDSEYESGKVSKRTARTAAAEAAKGRPAGVAPHGYRPEYDQRTGRLLNWVENPEESAVPRELFRRLRAGESLGSITRTLAAAGHVNRSGKPFTQQHLRTMATRHAYAGLRAHRPVKKVDGQKQPMTVTDATQVSRREGRMGPFLRSTAPGLSVLCDEPSECRHRWAADVLPAIGVTSIA